MPDLDLNPDNALTRAIAQLDPDDDAHWTTGGIPNLAVLTAFALVPVSRAMVQAADPHLTRKLIRQRRDAEVAELIGDEGGLESPEVPETPEIEVLDTPEALAIPEALPTPEEVLAMSPAEVWDSPDLLEIALQGLDAQSKTLSQERKAIDAELRVVGARSASISRRLEGLRRANPKPNTDFQRYLASQEDIRVARAARSAELAASGVTVEALKTLLDPRAPIDRAMAHRRPARGSVRPQFASRT